MKRYVPLLRSLAVYRLRPRHHRGLVALYRPFLPSGGLAFDIGAHVGDRTRAFRALGARVVTLEPQDAAFNLLRLLHGRDKGVTLLKSAAGADVGRAQMRINSANPTVSTLSDAFVSDTDGARGWEGQRWDRAEEVAVTTLDSLIAAHGAPDFIKVDVEGFEADVLAGLSVPAAHLSFEVVMAARVAGQAALDRCVALGYSAFRFSRGESHRFETEWLSAAEMGSYLRDLPDEANSGDVYARV
ncbi:MAG: FkbM family methyltransferase [Pseudomonadota bacterium]